MQYALKIKSTVYSKI